MEVETTVTTSLPPTDGSAAPGDVAPVVNGTTSHAATTDTDATMQDGDAPKQDEDSKDKPVELPEGASEVVYVHNLNEKIHLPVMKQSLKVLFREYGRVLGVTAHRNVRMRGQAFVTLESKDAAVKAVREVQKFPLYGKPMVSRHRPMRTSR